MMTQQVFKPDLLQNGGRIRRFEVGFAPRDGQERSLPPTDRGLDDQERCEHKQGSVLQ